MKHCSSCGRPISVRRNKEALALCWGLEDGQSFGARIVHSETACLDKAETDIINWGDGRMVFMWIPVGGLASAGQLDNLLGRYEGPHHHDLTALARTIAKSFGVVSAVGRQRVRLVRWLMRKGVDCDEARLIASRKYAY